jgi:ABC-type transport system involved in multi-copper enzyme maturation permease subunit
VSIAAPRYTAGPLARVSRAQRAAAIVRNELLRRTGLGTSLVVALTYAVVTVTVVLVVEVSSIAGNLSLSVFYAAFSSQAWPFLILIVSTTVGAGSIADDVGNRSITLYLSRPIHWIDYLLAKAAAVGAWIALVAIGPGVVGVVVGAALGFIPESITLSALAGFLAVGLLVTIFFTGLALALSSLTTKSLYAGVAIFGLTLSVGIGASVVQGITGNQYVAYASPLSNIFGVAQYAFDVGGTPVTNPAASALVLAGAGVFLGAIAAWRISKVEVVGE